MWCVPVFVSFVRQTTKQICFAAYLQNNVVSWHQNCQPFWIFMWLPGSTSQPPMLAYQQIHYMNGTLKVWPPSFKQDILPAATLPINPDLGMAPKYTGETNSGLIIMFLPRDAMHKPGPWCCTVSICLNITFICNSVKMSKRALNTFSPSDSHTILVFLY